MAESRNISDKRIASYWLDFVMAFNNVTFDKSCTVTLFSFNSKKRLVQVFLGPGFGLRSPLHRNSGKISSFLHLWQYAFLMQIRNNYVIFEGILNPMFFVELISHWLVFLSSDYVLFMFDLNRNFIYSARTVQKELLSFLLFITLPVFFPSALITEILAGSPTRPMSLASDNVIKLILEPQSHNTFRLT